MEDSNSCYNCNYKLGEETNFCPNCGQKVDNNNLTLKAVFFEFYENYLSFDTKMGRSVVPFLFIPGKLTKKFIDGKRVSFVNPFRFYLVISILFFYSLGTVLNDSFSRNSTQKSEFSKKITEEVDKAKKTKELRELSQILDSIQPIDSLQLDQINYDSLLKANGLSETISFEVDNDSTDKEIKKKKKSVFLNIDDSNISFDLSDFKTVKKYRHDFEYSNTQLLDTVGVNSDSVSEFRYTILSQAMKLYRSD